MCGGGGGSRGRKGGQKRKQLRIIITILTRPNKNKRNFKIVNQTKHKGNNETFVH